MDEADFTDKMHIVFESQAAFDLQTTPQNPDTLPQAYGSSGHYFSLWFILICWTGNYRGRHADQPCQP